LLIRNFRARMTGSDVRGQQGERRELRRSRRSAGLVYACYSTAGRRLFLLAAMAMTETAGHDDLRGWLVRCHVSSLARGFFYGRPIKMLRWRNDDDSAECIVDFRGGFFSREGTSRHWRRAEERAARCCSCDYFCPSEYRTFWTIRRVAKKETALHREAKERDNSCEGHR
jgi:hypothetical protein